jgi:hypothetical protein
MTEQIIAPPQNIEKLIQTSIFKVLDTFAEKKLSFMSPKHGASLNLQDFYHELTTNECFLLSKRVIENILIENNDQIKQVLLIRGRPMDRQLSPTPFKKKDWVQHFYGCIQDLSENWFAFSPANYDPKNPQTLLKITTAESLQSMLDQIKQEEGGTWPNESEIHKALQGSESEIPVAEF